MKTRGGLAGVLLLATVLAGCAAQSWVPGWVPLVGKKQEGPPAARALSPGAELLPAPAVGQTVTKPAPAETDEAVADRIVAIVNNDAITLAELQESVLMFRQENRQTTTVSDDDLIRQFLTRLIDNRLQLQEADRDKIAVDEVELSEEIAERMKRFGTKTLEEFEALVKGQGLTVEAVKKRLRDSLRVSKVIRRRVALRVSVTDTEINRYIEENRDKLDTGLSYHARHILIVPAEDTDAGWEAARIRAPRHPAPGRAVAGDRGPDPPPASRRGLASPSFAARLSHLPSGVEGDAGRRGPPARAPAGAGDFVPAEIRRPHGRLAQGDQAAGDHRSAHVNKNVDSPVSGWEDEPR